MRKLSILAVVSAAWLASLALPAIAQAGPGRSTEYMSQHPLPRKIGHGFCYIDVPHFHDFPPSDARLYRVVDGQYYFVGDPTPFSYEGPKYAYYGAHPVAEAHVSFGQPVYCHLRGPHYHWYEPAPAAEASFEQRGGAYWYVGAYPQTYYDERPRYVVVNDAYAPIVYTRPVVDVAVAPPAFHGELVGGGPGWRGAAVVGAPAVAAGVYVATPPPPSVHIGVGVNFGGPPVSSTTVIERREVYVRERHHHDNGRHRGWVNQGPGPGPAPQRGSGWRAAPMAAQPAPARAGGGWRGGAAPAPAAPAAGGGGWRGGGGGGNAKKQSGWRR